MDPDPREVLRRLAERPDRACLLRYRTPLGAPRHRAAGIDWLARLGMVGPRVDDVLVTAGAQHALYVVFSHLARRQRTLYVEELTHPGALGAAEALDLRVVPVAIDEEGLCPSDLERACRSNGPGTLFCVPTIHNPTGAVMSESRRRAIAGVACERGLLIVEDAANRMLVSLPPPLLWTFAPERTYLVASVSKVLCAGVRVAYVVAPEGELPALARGLWATQWMVSPFGPEIVAMWLEDGTVNRVLARKRKEAPRRQSLAARLFGSDSTQAHPRSLHVWIHTQPGTDLGPVIRAASQGGVVATPAMDFWARRTRPPDAFRLALGGVDRFAELAHRLGHVSEVLSSCEDAGA